MAGIDFAIVRWNQFSCPAPNWNERLGVTSTDPSRPQMTSRLKQSACSMSTKWIMGALLAGLIVLYHLPASAGSLVAVGVKSGRVFVGEIDGQTNHDELILRIERNGVSIFRPISWDAIVLGGDGQHMFSREELMALADKVRSSDRSNTPPIAKEPQAIVPEELTSPSQWEPDIRQAQFIQAAKAANSQIAFISLDARVANWNRTVEADGVLLHVYPMSAHGKVIPVDGTLEVQLIATVPPGWRQGVAFPHIGRWTLRVSREQFGPSGAVFRLPFQAKHPEFDMSMQPTGLVHVRLNVPGNGSFEASQSMVRIRPYSSVRDQLQQNDRRRFFDVERTERFGPR